MFEKFQVACKECGSERCELEEEYMDSYGEDYSLEYVYMGTKIICLECGEKE
ncbi:hypothetical protein QTG56_24165 (plasmid) [Rossellomorea sp. AcN35-11]|nr:hypothetical protein [Rossellomorea aquimaris]WJV31735.1 hypothetical protein QTG56_24165 [Rossellomorea sp. AcN35-11]